MDCFHCQKETIANTNYLAIVGYNSGVSCGTIYFHRDCWLIVAGEDWDTPLFSSAGPQKMSPKKAIIDRFFDWFFSIFGSDERPPGGWID